VVLFFGCGGGNGGDGAGGSTAPPPPTVHPLDASTGRVAPAMSLWTGPFTLPAGATVTYVVTDMPTGVGQDSMRTAVVNQAQFSSTGPITGYADQRATGSRTAVTPPLPADGYYFVVGCNNILDDCLFSKTVTAYY